MDLGRVLRERLRAAFDSEREGERGKGAAANVAAAVNVSNSGHVTSVYSDGHVTIIRRDGQTEVIRHDEQPADQDESGAGPPGAV